MTTLGDILSSQTYAQVRTTLGIGTGDSPTLAGLTLSSGDMNIASSAAYKINGRSIAIAQTALNNFFLGDAGNLTATGSGNTAVGSRALMELTSGGDNTAVGNEALRNMTFAVGNTAMGKYALQATVEGTNNTAIGDSALRFTLSANANTAVGYRTAEGNVTGHSNVFIGNAAGLLRTAGNENVIIGHTAMSTSATGGNNNTAVGFNALTAYPGSDNTAIGHNSMAAATTGAIQNTAVGLSSGGSITTGTTNVFIGWSAGTNVSQKVDAVNSIAIGHQAYTTADNQVVLGNSSITETLLRGNVGIGTAPGANLHVEGGDTGADLTLNLNDRIKVTGDGVFKWGSAATHGLLSWDTGVAQVGGLSGNALALWADGAEQARVDNDVTAGNSRFLLYDVTAATIKRVSFGAADSGGVGFKVLRVAN